MENCIQFIIYERRALVKSEKGKFGYAIPKMKEKGGGFAEAPM